MKKMYILLVIGSLYSSLVFDAIGASHSEGAAFLKDGVPMVVYNGKERLAYPPGLPIEENQFSAVGDNLSVGSFRSAPSESNVLRSDEDSSLSDTASFSTGLNKEDSDSYFRARENNLFAPIKMYVKNEAGEDAFFLQAGFSVENGKSVRFGPVIVPGENQKAELLLTLKPGMDIEYYLVNRQQPKDRLEISAINASDYVNQSYINLDPSSLPEAIEGTQRRLAFLRVKQLVGDDESGLLTIKRADEDEMVKTRSKMKRLLSRFTGYKGPHYYHPQAKYTFEITPYKHSD